MMKRLFSKILVLVIVLSINFVGATNAYLFDTESSNGSTFTAGSVDLSLKDAGGVVLASPLFNISGMKPGNSETKTVKVTKEGTLDFHYSVKAIETGGDDVLCDALKIEAKLDGVSQYDASLTGLNLNPASTITGSEDVWDFTVKLDNSDSGLQEKSCAFDIEIKGWQIGSDGTWGLTDDENISNSVTTGCWVAPTVPVLSSPANNTHAGLGSAWDLNPVMDWDNSMSSCSSAAIEYQYESYSDSGLSSIIYQSGWLSNSFIPASGTPDGSYYWRVRSRDQYGNESVFSTQWLLVVDRVAPVISSVSHLIATPDEGNSLKAIITWLTNEPSTSNLKWHIGLDPWTFLTEDTTADETSHTREITGLSSNTDYQFEVISKDASGNEASVPNSLETDGITSQDFIPTTDIVINEFLPNPAGADDAAMPGGEWVELYNNSNTNSYDLTGWSIGAYNNDTYRLHLTLVNTISSDPLTSGLTIGPHEFFVVYRNGNSTFYMKNGADDRIRLFNAANVRVDRYMYTASQVLENKSIARFPDGSGTWFDPIPTPAKPNQLEAVPAVPADSEVYLDLSSSKDKRSVDFKVYGETLSQFESMEYTITYDSEQGEQGVKGTKNIEGKNEISAENILLGSCSSGGTCVYHSGVTKVTLEVILKGSVEKTLSKEISF